MMICNGVNSSTSGPPTLPITMENPDGYGCNIQHQCTVVKDVLLSSATLAIQGLQALRLKILSSTKQ